MNDIVRETRETRVRAAFARNGSRIDVRTCIPFLDHMLVTFARYADAALTVEASGDLRHHIIEDVAITVGAAVREALPPACTRYGHRVVAMDDALVEVTLDLGGRRYYRGPLPARLYDHWMRSFVEHAQCTLHIRVLRGRDRHHVIEAAFKALGFALRDAAADASAIMSTKGDVRLNAACSPGD